MTDAGRIAVDAVAPRRSLKDQVFESVRTAIAERRLEVGRLYSVEALSKTLDVSRTPVREALLDLAGRGMVHIERNQGFRVVQMSVEDLREVLTLRLLAEVPATHHAARLATDDEIDDLEAQVDAMLGLRDADDSLGLLAADRRFHRRIVELAGSSRLAEHLDHLRDLMTLHDHYSDDVRRDLDRHLDDHGPIVAGLRRRDPAAAAAAARAHVLHIAHDMLVHAGDADGSLPWADAVVIGPGPREEQPS